MKVAKYVFHLSFQLTAGKLFLSGTLEREGRREAHTNMYCRGVSEEWLVWQAKV